MSVRIRFKRIGKPHNPVYRMVAISRTSARDAEPIEVLGTFLPGKTAKPEEVNLERIKYWLSVGALPTESVQFALKKAGIWDQIKPRLSN